MTPNPDKPELKFEDCKFNIYGYRFALSFLKSKKNLYFHSVMEIPRRSIIRWFI